MRIPSTSGNRAVLYAALLAATCSVRGAKPAAAPAKHKYTTDVAALAAKPAPRPGGILMVGSSIFRKWTTAAEDLAPLPVTNRAFGGSKTEDQLFFFDKIVPSSKAALVVWYCGSNDIKGNLTPESILKNTREWIGRTQAALPGAKILLLSVIRAPEKRADGLLALVDETNSSLRALATTFSSVAFVDVNPALEDDSREPVMDCYVSDKLHLSPEGYRRMTKVLKPAIEQNWNAPLPASPSTTSSK